MTTTVDWTQAKRDNLYFSFRYRNHSYKARKAGIQPILITAKYSGAREQIRVYGESGQEIEPAKIKFATTKFKAWKQTDKEQQKLKRGSSKIAPSILLTNKEQKF